MTIDRETLVKRVQQCGYWYHRIALPGGVVTPGWAPLVPQAYRLPDDLRDLRVLDVGAWDGYWTWEALRRGARQVLAIDDFSDPVAHEGWEPWRTFDLCASALGYDRDWTKRLPGLCRVWRLELPVYDLDPRVHGRFDVILFFGTLYHCRHPLLALDRLAGVAAPGARILVESAVVDRFGAYSRYGYPNAPLLEFYADDQYGANSTNWWGPTLPAVAELLRAAGWTGIEAQLLEVPPHVLDTPEELQWRRGFAQAVWPRPDA